LIKETMMRKQTSLAALAAALVVSVLPSKVDAYGAAHVGYTHVGSNGVYHTGETAARGPGGTYAGGHTGAYGAGGATYHSGHGAAAAPGGAAAGGYRYTTTPGGASAGAYHYGYVR
jgi:hypothetical protein